MATILVIDDDSVTRLVIKKALQSQGHTVILAASGQSGLEQASQLQPSLIVCDWMMPGIDGLEVCRQVKANRELSTTFFILLTSRGGVADRIQGLNTGADDFLSKPIDLGELQARVQAGLRLHHLSQDLQDQKQRLEAELAEAATYVQSLLPTPMEGIISIDAHFVPSRQLGGDCFDYFWLDPDYLVVYLLDVSGHGIGAALPSSLILNLLRLQSLPDVNLYQPHDVLRALNETFQMSRQNDKYFTIWYGVYNPTKRQLTYASAGHPPAILISPTVHGLEVKRLKTPCIPIGMLSDVTFTSDRLYIPFDSTLYIFSDGVFDINHGKPPSLLGPSGLPEQPWGFESFINLLITLDPRSGLDQVLAQAKAIAQVDNFDDDVSLLKVSFS